ncbi:MAG: hypothetical protein M0D55_04755 [Elusimicrobiota bacterium]|nr:MAG: hypothetical protein M0D55_04755 [Elusimicrobiota bacterium]
MNGRLARGIEAFNAGRHAEAARLFRAAIAAGEDAASARGFLAHALDASGRTMEAVRLLSRLSPSAGLADVAVRALAREDGPAPRALLRALAPLLRRRDVRDAAVRALVGRGQGAGSARRWKEAEPPLRLALGLSPRDAGASLWLGRVLAASGRLAEAARLLRAAGDAAREDLLGVELELARAESNPGRAKARLRAAARLSPSDPRPREALAALDAAQARAALAAGNWARAERLLRARGRNPAALASALAARAWDDAARGRAAAGQARLREADALDPARAASRARLLAALDARSREHRRGPDDGEEALYRLKLREQRCRLTGELVRREGLLRAIARAASPESPERFKALMNLRRYPQALALAERVLDAGATQADAWAFSNPWDWEDWTSRDARMRGILRDLERRLAGRPGPWLDFYRGILGQETGLAAFARLARRPRARYAWMLTMAGRCALVEGRLSEAESWLRGARSAEPPEWRARACSRKSSSCAAARRPPRRRWTRPRRSRRRATPGSCSPGAAPSTCGAGTTPRPCAVSTRPARSAPRTPGAGAAPPCCCSAGPRRRSPRSTRPSPFTPATLRPSCGAPRPSCGSGGPPRRSRISAAPRRACGRRSCAVWPRTRRRRWPPCPPRSRPGSRSRGPARRALEAALALARGWRREEYGQALWLSRPPLRRRRAFASMAP